MLDLGRQSLASIFEQIGKSFLKNAAAVTLSETSEILNFGNHDLLQKNYPDIDEQLVQISLDKCDCRTTR